MRNLKLIVATIYLFTSFSAFAQLRGSVSTGSSSTTMPPSSTSQSSVANTTSGTANYGTDTTSVTPSTSTDAVSSSPVSTRDTAATPVTTATPTVTPASTAVDTTAAGGYAPIVTDNSGIQSAGKSSSGNNKIGLILGIGATAYAAYNAVASCSSESPKCPWWIAGTVAAVAVTGYMATAKKKSDSTVDAVTDPSAVTGTAGTAATGTTSDGTSAAAAYNQDPAWQNAQSAINQLKSSGWNIDPTTGTATNTKTGQTISASDLTSPAAMSAAGFSSADIKGIQDVMAQAQAAGQKLAATRGADASGSLFDGTAGGTKSGVSASFGGATGGAALRAAAASQGAGVNRDPAQVAGMSKSFNGEQIGVAQDSLFNMIDRRYQLHDKNGSFLNQ